MKKQLLTAAIALMAAAVCAQDNQLTIDAQLRTRGEHNNGAVTERRTEQQAANFVNERARLSFDFRRQNLELKASVQHTGVWGQDDIKEPNGRATMNEAWAKLTFKDDFFAQIGRQQLSYDDERILGSLDWNVNGNWHDALKLGYEHGQHKAHVILAMNQTAENNRGDFYSGPMPYKNLEALWYHYQAQSLPLDVSVLALNVGLEIGVSGHGRTNYLQTFGTDISLKPGDWDIHAAAYYQMGKDYYSRTVSAWMASGKVGYTIDPLLAVNVGYDIFSANGDDINKWNAFNPLYGTHHKFLGAMDYFTTMQTYGLHDIQAGVASQFCKAISAKLDYHCFMIGKDVNGLDKFLGHEIDLQVSARLMKDVTLTAGYSTMLGTETLDYIKYGDHNSWQDWGWVQLNITPRIF